MKTEKIDYMICMAQSLARIRNQVREECIDILCTHDGPENAVDVIRAMKEQE